MPSRSEIRNAVDSAVQRYGEPISAQEYTNWRLDNDQDLPRKLEILREYSVTDWEEFCDEISVDGIERSENSTLTVLMMKLAMAEAVDYQGEPFTEEEYNSYHDSRLSSFGDYPSSDKIKDVFGYGSWERTCNRLGITPAVMDLSASNNVLGSFVGQHILDQIYRGSYIDQYEYLREQIMNNEHPTDAFYRELLQLWKKFIIILV